MARPVTVCPSPAEDVLESYENPPPIVLPSEGFQVDLEADCLDDSIYQHLLYIRHFLWSLRSKPSPGGGPSQPEYLQVPGSDTGPGCCPGQLVEPRLQKAGDTPLVLPPRWAPPVSPSIPELFLPLPCLQGPHHTTPEGHPEGQSCPLVSRGAREASQMRALPSSGAPRAQGPPGRQSRGGPQAGPLHADSSCLLTPPGTPLSLEPAVPDWPEPGGTCGQTLLEGRKNGQSGSRGAAPEGEGLYPSPAGTWADPLWVIPPMRSRGPVWPGLLVPAREPYSLGHQTGWAAGPRTTVYGTESPHSGRRESGLR